MHPVIIALTILSASVPMIVIWTALYALRQKRRYKPALALSNETPRCSVILPCKGFNDTLETNIRSFFSLNYSNYEVVITVESESDSAVPVIRKVLSEYRNGRLVVAGITKSCGQKNFNLVSAVDTVVDSEILIFADSDIKLFPNWINSITIPLLSNKATAVTGFRWLYPTDNNMGDLAHSLQNFILYSFFVTAAHKVNTGLWGGSMSIRKSDYERLNVKETWLRTSVDDMSLSQILKREGETTLFAYDCITPTSDTIKSLRGAVRWLERQVMYLKAHQRPEWICAQLAAMAYLSSYVLLGYATIAAIFFQQNFFLSGGIAWFIQTGLAIVLTMLFPAFGEKGRWKSFIIASPVSFYTAAYGTIRTMFKRKITWSGFRYTINMKDGTVTKVERLQK